MVRVSRILGLVIAVMVTACTSAFGALVVNEVMANEPGTARTLEWIELYNTSSNSVDLSLCELRVNGTVVAVTGTVAPASYQIICRKKFDFFGTPGFETYWGDNSGLWGDTLIENYPEPIEATTLDLPNDSGRVVLLEAGVVVSELAWHEVGKDGFSWERTTPAGSEILQSIDYSGSTPGTVNSHTPAGNDLSLDTVVVSHSSTGADFVFTVTNMGVTSAVGRRLLVCEYNPVMPDSIGNLISTISVPTLEVGYSTDITKQLTLDGVYMKLSITLDSDDRVRNNKRIVTAPGVQYPPLILSEIMSAPESPLATEWIELYCPHSSAFTVDSWQIGDALSSYVISDSAFPVPSHSYVVLTEDSTLFRQFYAGFTGKLVQPNHWPDLNDNGDLVRLIDRYGILADSFRYSSSYDSNFTWSRALDSTEAVWGRSTDVGGSPGDSNGVLIRPTSDRLSLIFEPQVFSPDGDGYQDVCTIILDAPSAKSYTLKIYDREGRLVRQFADKSELIYPQYTWDGKTDAGNRLPIGIYICLFEATDVQSIKKPVVIAR